MTDAHNHSADPLHAKKEAWSGRFSEPVAEFVLRYTQSVSFDKRMAAADIAGSLAHAQMLAACGVISEQDLADIRRGMAQISDEIKTGKFLWQLELEDVHLNIEARLTQLIGDAGKRLHTGRSRNDQVATDIRLYLRTEIDQIIAMLGHLQEVLVHNAAKESDTLMPGFTHMQVAQPVSFGHHLLAYVEMFERDRERMTQLRSRVNRCPLGAAALAGTTYPIDREMTAKLLGFEAVCQNSLDAVSDRDFGIEFTAAASLVMIHISRLSEELVVWMSQRFSFIKLPDRFTTGSSIMPQKKNPDVPETARGKCSRVVGDLVSMAMLMKGLPLAYNKDLQEDKEPVFDAIDTVKDTLRAFIEMMAGVPTAKKCARRFWLVTRRLPTLPTTSPAAAFPSARLTTSSAAWCVWQVTAAATSPISRSKSCANFPTSSPKTSTTCLRSKVPWPPATTSAARLRRRFACRCSAGRKSSPNAKRRPKLRNNVRLTL